MKPFDVYPLFDIEPVKGLGNYLWDKKGEKYLDLYGGHAVISIGHSHPEYVKKLQEQTANLVFYSNSVKNSLQEELAQKLGKLSNCENYNLFLCNSGAEANENALKTASFFNRRKKVIAFQKGFHGRTSGAVSITDNPNIIAPFNENDNVQILPLNDEQALENAIDENTSAIIIEGLQGIAGIYEPSISFLQKVANLCKEHNTLLILDEVQSGYGRTGDFFAFQKANIEPDIITVAKGMGNGFPIGGVLIHERIKAKHGMLGTTFGGNHLACAAGIAVLDVIEKEQLINNAITQGNYLLEELTQIDAIKETRGRGLMIAIEMPYEVAELRKKLLFEHKIFTGSASNKNTIRILPPLNIGTKEIDLFINALKKLVPLNFVS